MAWIWFLTCCGRGRTVDRFYLYIGLGQWLIPQSFDELPSQDRKED